MFTMMLTHTLTANPNKPFLGIGFSEYVTDEINGLKIDYIVPNSAAEEAKLKKSDIIYMIDYQYFPTNNITTFFKDYIKDNKKINEKMKLNILRESITIKKAINNDFIAVDFTINDIKNEINDLDYTQNTTFKFEKMITSILVEPILTAQPFMQQTSPNIQLPLFPEINFIAPYYTLLFNKLSQTETYSPIIKTLKEKNYLNEFWNDNHRTNIIQFLHTQPEKIPAFTSLLNQRLLSTTPKKSLNTQMNLIDLKQTPLSLDTPQSTDFNDHLKFILNTISNAKLALNKAFEKLSTTEKEFIKKQSILLSKKLDKSFVLNNLTQQEKHDIVDFFEYIKKVNLNELFTGYQYLMTLNDPTWLHHLQNTLDYMPSYKSDIKGISGDIIFSQTTAFGLLVIGSNNQNTYTNDVSFIIDTGGDDIYRNNAGGAFENSLINVVIDLKGNDFYSSNNPFSQGSANLGYGLLIDLAGDDHYQSDSLSQGAAIVGIGYLIDHQGTDHYDSTNFSQGFALYGCGSIFDETGDDSYTASLFSQGVGVAKGTGSIFDLSGDDIYSLISNKQSSYGSVGIFKGAGQGFGFGVRHFASGGIGLLYDNTGDDTYRAGNFSQGTGYYYGLGLAIDKHGNDTYIGSRYSMGTAAHSAIGILANITGNDSYKTLQGSSIAIAWDYSNAFLLDRHGNDVYDCLDKSFCLGSTDHNSFAFFNDKNGTDTYKTDFKQTVSQNTYNDGKSLGIFLDEAGQNDVYLTNNLNNKQDQSNESFLFIDSKDSLIFFDLD